MPTIIQGDSSADGLRFGVMATRFHDDLVSGLLSGALECLTRHGASEDSITVFRAPGAFELPSLARRLVVSEQFDALIALGVLIRGDTPHFDFISAQVTSGLSTVALDGVPVAFGVITCDDLEQARVRSGPGPGNKGWEAALAAIEMANLFRQIPQPENSKHEGSSQTADVTRPSAGKAR